MLEFRNVKSVSACTSWEIAAAGVQSPLDTASRSRGRITVTISAALMLLFVHLSLQIRRSESDPMSRSSQPNIAQSCTANWKRTLSQYMRDLSLCGIHVCASPTKEKDDSGWQFYSIFYLYEKILIWPVLQTSLFKSS